MFKNLNPSALGVSGWQSELIELALTYKFGGLDVDIADLAKTANTEGGENAKRFLESADIPVGAFDLPVRWQGSEADYQADLAELENVAAVAASVKATRCETYVMAASDELPYHENFEFHRKRLTEIADVLAKHGVRLGIGFRAAPVHREGKQYQFIFEAEPLVTLIKTIGNPNVGLALDLWNWRLGGGSADELGDLTGEQVVSVKLADVPADVDPTTINDHARLLPEADESSLSAKTLAVLGSKGYDGPVTVYPHPSTLGSFTRDSIVQKASNIYDDACRAAGLTAPAVAETDDAAEEEAAPEPAA